MFLTFSAFMGARICVAAQATPKVKPNHPFARILDAARINPALRQALLSEINRLPELAKSPPLILHNLWPPYFDAHPGTQAEERRFEAQQIVMGVLVRPDAISDTRENVARIFGSEQAHALESAAYTLWRDASSRPHLSARLEDVRKKIDVSDAGSMAHLGRRLIALFDDGGTSSTDVDAPTASIEAYLLGNTRRGGPRTVSSLRGFKEAAFDPQHYDPAYEPALRRLGYDAVAIQDPSGDEIEFHGDFALRSPKVRWMLPVPGSLSDDLHEYTLALPDRKQRQTFQKSLADSANVPVEVAPLTPKDYEDRFFPFYERTVEVKKGGKLMVGPDWARKEMSERGGLRDWFGIYYLNPMSPADLIGAILVNLWRERGFVTMAYGGYLQDGETRKFELNTRTFTEALKLAVQHGFPLLSFGMDPNLFGLDANIGLVTNKSRHGMLPFPNGPLQLYKALNADKVRAEGNNAGKNEGILFFALRKAGPLIERYLALRTGSQAPQTHQLVGEPFFGPDALSGPDIMFVKHFTDSPGNIAVKTPEKMEVVRQPMPTILSPDTDIRRREESIALQKTRLAALRGKRILIVGAGYERKRFILDRARELGVRVALIEKGNTGFKRLAARILAPWGVSIQDHWARELVSEFIAANTADYQETLRRVRRHLRATQGRYGRLDGITTFWEDDVEETARLAQDLGLAYNSPAGVARARDKHETLRLIEAGYPTERYREEVPRPQAVGKRPTERYREEVPRPQAVGKRPTERYREEVPRRENVGDRPPGSHIISDASSLEEALKRILFPAVLKPKHGAAAMLTVRVDTPEEARAEYEKNRKLLTAETDSIFGRHTDEPWFILQEYIPGREYDVDVEKQNGKILFVSITDNWPTREPYFIGAGSSLPSRKLNYLERRKAEKSAVEAVEIIGLGDGVYHVEGKYTDDGPRIIEVNARMGGVYVRDWVKTVWGVDLVDEQLMIAAGIPAGPYKPAEPLAYLEGKFFIPEQPGILRELTLTPDAQKDPALHRLMQLKKPGDRINPPFDARVAMLVVRGSSQQEAQEALARIESQVILRVAPTLIQDKRPKKP